MANSIEQWIDSEALRKLAEDLMVPMNDPEEAASGEVFGQDFVGFLGDPSPPVQENDRQLEGARRALEEARRKADDAGLVSEGPATKPLDPRNVTPSDSPVEPAPAHASPKESPFRSLAPKPAAPEKPSEKSGPASLSIGSGLSPDSPLYRRLKAFAVWLRQFARADSIFLVDQAGAVLLDDCGNPKLLSVARSLGLATGPARDEAPPRPRRVRLGPEHQMEVLAFGSRFGVMILGVVDRQNLSVEELVEIRRAVSLVLTDHR